TRTAWLAKAIPQGANRAALDFWFYYEKSPSTTLNFASIDLNSLQGAIILLMEPEGNFHLAEQYYPAGGGMLQTHAGAFLGAIRLGQPRHVTLEVVQALVDGVPAARATVDGDTTYIKLFNKMVDPRKAFIGSTYSADGPQGDDVFFFDDVTIDA